MQEAVNPVSQDRRLVLAEVLDWMVADALARRSPSRNGKRVPRF